MLYGETVHSPLPQDIPWWAPDFAIFFGILYLVLFCIAVGVGIVLLRSWMDVCCTKKNTHDHGCCCQTEEAQAIE